MNADSPIEVIATSISGSVKDWGKVDRILPLFREHGLERVRLTVADTHQAARIKACELARSGMHILISAGGSGTFNAVVEGCYDAGVDLAPLRLGFLRKGSADLIGKVLGMPDDIGEAVAVFVEAIRQDRTTPCDVLLASSEQGQVAARHFVGYGGAEIFGEIPYFTDTVGNTQTGMAIAFGACLNAPAVLVSLSYMAVGSTVCCEYPVLPHPDATSGEIEFADCNQDKVLGTGGALCLKCTSPVEPSTWGKVKSLYAQ